ncbi:MAG: PAS domain S-box protein [Acidimicrobiales bacterium]
MGDEEHNGRALDSLSSTASTRATPVDVDACLRAVLDYSPSSIFVKDLQGRYLLVNEEWSRVTGIECADALGRSAAECWPDEASDIAAHEQALLETRTFLVTDERMSTVDGPRDFMVVRFFLSDPEGRPTAIAGIATDITDRKRIESELVGHDQLLATVMGASPDIITILDRDGRVQQVSDAGRTILGYGRDAVRDAEGLGIVHPEDLQEVTRSFDALIDGSIERVHLRCRVRHAAGHWVTVDCAAQTLVDDKQRFAGAVVVTRDVTDELAAENRLRDAREAAEATSAATSEFLLRMSHELRTPLNSLLGFAQLLQMDELTSEQADCVDHILAASRHLLDLTDEVLDIASIQSGHLELTMTSVPVLEVTSEAVEFTRPLAKRTGVSLHVDIDPERVLRVKADRQRLLQVLLNLLSNAVKYNHPGGRVVITCDDAGNDRLRLAVADTGRGIRPEDLWRVFEPFDRLGAELSDIEGTGVGLSLSRQLTERMGGRLDFESVPEEGTTFFVELDTADPEGEKSA